jgi:hypothetical protein
MSLVMIAAVMISSGAQFGSSSVPWNGTVYHLSGDRVQVTLPVNASKMTLTLYDQAENMTLFDEHGKNISFNSSYRYQRGDHIYGLDFAAPVQGKLIYSVSQQGQQFVLPIQSPGPVRIILPTGYTTGDRSLGIARPEPDQFMDGASGSVLTWNNTTQIPYIEVNYYRRSAPMAMTIIFAILGMAGLVFLVQYYLSIRKLKAARREMENEWR